MLLVQVPKMKKKDGMEELLGFVLQVEGAMQRPGKPIAWMLKCVVNNLWMWYEQGRAPLWCFYVWNVKKIKHFALFYKLWIYTGYKFFSHVLVRHDFFSIWILLSNLKSI